MPQADIFTIEDYIKKLLSEAVSKTAASKNQAVPERLSYEVERPKHEGQGDRASSAAMQLVKAWKMPPRDIAAALIAEMLKISEHDGLLAKIEVAGPGFINFFLAPKCLATIIKTVMTHRDDYGASDIGHGRKMQVEFVSANPTGPLHIGHGRGAAVGDVLANILTFAGWSVEREYYINDAGRQMSILGRSTQSRYFEELKQPDKAPFPEDGYKGDYIYDLAKKAIADEGDRFLAMPLEESLPWFKKFAGDFILNGIKKDLRDFGVVFDVWFSESTLYTRNLVPQAMERLKERDYAFEKDGALWFKSSDFKDDKDRVLIRNNGIPTYFASDIAYHKDKFDRGFERVVDIWGADHHGYVPRMKAGIEALGRSPDNLDVLLIQFVNLVRDGVQVPMSTRSGQFVTLRDVLDEVGVDATRYFFLMRSSDSQLDFDLELAKRQNSDNPIYYVQYAYARISSIMREVAEADKKVSCDAISADVLADENTRKLVDCLAFFPIEMKSAAEKLAPHALTAYVFNLASCFHAFYNTNRILGEAAPVESTRLVLTEAVRVVLKRCLDMLGVSAPERM